MHVDLNKFINAGDTVAVALSGGSDSMALLHYMQSQAEKYRYFLVAINVEHGIRGQSSISDTEFVKEYCKNRSIPIYCYSVDSIKNAKDNKLSIEQSARALRYQCFYDAISSGKCNVVATAHHSRDNLESVLFNLFRGTGLKGATGIEENFNGKIIRPFLSVSKDEIDEYVNQNDIPFVTDPTNLSDDYTRNYIRLNVLPEIKKLFPEVEKSVYRFTTLLRADDEYLDRLAKSVIIEDNAYIKIPVNTDKVLFGRAVIYALKRLGVEKDWEKSHVDGTVSLLTANNGSSVNLKKGVIAIKEYDFITLFRATQNSDIEKPFTVGETCLSGQILTIEAVTMPSDFTNGFYIDGDKIPSTAVIRFKRNGDKFTKFGGGTKSLNDFLTDKKIPLRLRDSLPVIANGEKVLAIKGVAISDNVKVDDSTKKIYKIY